MIWLDPIPVFGIRLKAVKDLYEENAILQGKADPKHSMYSMVGMLVPLKGGLGSIVHPPIGRYVIPLIYHL